jgi:hypothetical protein
VVAKRRLRVGSKKEGHELSNCKVHRELSESRSKLSHGRDSQNGDTINLSGNACLIRKRSGDMFENNEEGYLSRRNGGTR